MLTPIKRLARELAPLHDAFESSDLIMPRLQSREGYVRVLCGMHEVHSSAEPQLAAFRTAFDANELDLDRRAKLALIETELSQLGADRPVCHARSCDVTNFDLAWGWLYVLEGSTLGGAMLAKVVQKQLDLSPLYYGCYAQDTMPMWRSFGAALDAYVERDPRVYGDVLDGARACYAAFTKALA